MSDKEIFNIINNFLIKASKDTKQRKILYNKNEYILNEIQKKNKKLKLQKEKEIKEKFICETINKIQEANIDFTKTGCIKTMSQLTKIPTQHCSRFLKKYFPDLYEIHINKKRD